MSGMNFSGWALNADARVKVGKDLGGKGLGGKENYSDCCVVE
jgi:hypothetical protein